MVERREPMNVDYALGQITGRLDTITKTLSEERADAAQYRSEVRRQLAETNERLGQVSGDLNAAKTDIAEMKPKVVSLEQRALMSKGAANLAIMLGKLAHVVSAAVGGAIAIFLERWLHRCAGGTVGRDV